MSKEEPQHTTKHPLPMRVSHRAPWYLPKCIKRSVHVKTCTWMFTVSSFIISKTWKQPRRPSGGEWVNRPWCIQTMKYYCPVLGRKELSSREKTGRTQKCTRLSERRQPGKATYAVGFRTHATLQKEWHCVDRWKIGGRGARSTGEVEREGSSGHGFGHLP